MRATIRENPMEGQRIVCGKFDKKIDLHYVRTLNPKGRIRIGSANPNTLQPREFYPISTNGKMILHGDGLFCVRDFLSAKSRDQLKNLVVLTIKERNSILDELVDFDLRICVLEISYPIFRHIKYLSNIHKNYEELVRLIEVIKNLRIKGKSLAENISKEHSFRIERSLRLKNKLDHFFAFAYKGGYQEVFKFKEEKEDRSVIAFDFNSMYADCMAGDFIEPKSAMYINLRDENITPDQIANGLYRIVLKRPIKSFFRSFHPFKYCVLNKSFYFGLQESQEVELLLFRNEIRYYSKYFEDTEIIEGIVSKKSIRHPLDEYAKKLYQERLRYKSDGNIMMHDMCKFKLVTIHSATNSKKYESLRFTTAESLINHLSQVYMFDFQNGITPEENLKLIQDNKYFNFQKLHNGYQAKLIKFSSKESIYSLSAQIVANSRLKMIETIEAFLKYQSVEICYSNVDSLHISILTSEIENFLDEHKDIVSSKLGDLKIQSIADRGYWFDVGRYWLFKNDAVVAFKNQLFNHKGSKSEFLTSRKMQFLNKGKSYSYMNAIYKNIESSFAYNKRLVQDDQLDSWDYRRYDFNEVNDLSVAADTYDQEILDTKKTKVDLFRKIATV